MTKDQLRSVSDALHNGAEPGEVWGKIKGTTRLLYHGKAMNPQPINTQLSTVVISLKQGLPVVVQLEPGDGTHYALLIVPAWIDGVAEHLGRYGIRASTATSYLIVTQLNDHGGHAFFAFSEGVETWDMQDIKNEWTREVFSWWFNMLWNALTRAERAEGKEE